MIILLFLSLAWVSHSCSDSDSAIPLPPDYVDGKDDDNDSGIDVGDNTYHYITPKIGSNGQIIVEGTPADYADTAKYHVIAAAYDLNNSKAIDLEAYYASAVGKSGNQLKAALAAIVKKNFKPVTYGDVRYILVDADRNPKDDTKIWCAYMENNVEAAWDSGKTWNREHVWAKSKGLGGAIDNNEYGPASDVFNLRAETLSVNSEKSNRDFAEKDGDANFAGTHGSNGYAPMKSGRGDVARIMFYMELRWNEQCGIIIDENVSSDTGARHGKLSHLLKWHNDDPIDPFEIRRSNIVYSKQNNRNPFVDHPELVEYLYGDKKGQAWDGGVTLTTKN
ncbi:MAG: endonuclease I family protein [Mangrovibacterium sp.]